MSIFFTPFDYDASRYIKKPVVVEAFQFVGDNYPELCEWAEIKIGGEYPDVPFTWSKTAGVRIRTLEGMMHVSKGDWIIRGIQGEFYPCKPNIFEETYEAACPWKGCPLPRSRVHLH